MFFKQLLSILNRLSPYTFNHGQNRLYLPSSEHLDQSHDHKTSDQFPSSMDSRRQLLLLRCKVYFQLLSGQHLLQLCTFSLLCIQVVCKCLSRHVCCPTYIWISSLNKCGSGHRKLRVCVLRNPLWSLRIIYFSLNFVIKFSSCMQYIMFLMLSLSSCILFNL